MTHSPETAVELEQLRERLAAVEALVVASETDGTAGIFTTDVREAIGGTGCGHDSDDRCEGCGRCLCAVCPAHRVCRCTCGCPAPLLPWAARLAPATLDAFLADLAEAASGGDGVHTLAAVEAVLAGWRLGTEDRATDGAVEALGTAVRNAQDSDDAVLRCLTCGEDLDDENISDYCSEACGVIAAAMRQGRRTPAELAEACASHTAQIEELRQAVTVLRLRVAGLTDAADLVVADGEASCCVCGCTEDRPCVGGCHWVPAPRMRDLCSACAAVIPGSPTQTAADEWVKCANPRGCPRREKAARAAVMGWEDGLCPQCAAHAADRADFLARGGGDR